MPNHSQEELRKAALHVLFIFLTARPSQTSLSEELLEPFCALERGLAGGASHFMFHRIFKPWSLREEELCIWWSNTQNSQLESQAVGKTQASPSAAFHERRSQAAAWSFGFEARFLSASALKAKVGRLWKLGGRDSKLCKYSSGPGWPASVSKCETLIPLNKPPTKLETSVKGPHRLLHIPMAISPAQHPPGLLCFQSWLPISRRVGRAQWLTPTPPVRLRLWIFMKLLASEVTAWRPGDVTVTTSKLPK